MSWNSHPISVKNSLLHRDKLKAFIAVKRSERLPGKHFLKLGTKRIIDIVYEKVCAFADTTVVSTFPIDLHHILDQSGNIMELLSSLSSKNEEFMLVAGDMPFFSSGDVEILLKHYRGRTVIPKHEDGRIEPMFAIYHGYLEAGRSLSDMVMNGAEWVDASLFSRNAFFNINTIEDYLRAQKIFEKI